jgi:elongation factor P
MISTTDFRTGVTIEINGEPYVVVDFQHVKPGKGAAFVRTKLKNLNTGATTEQTFRPGEKFPRAHIDRKQMQYLYNSGDEYFFMDTETFEQVSIQKEDLGDAVKWMKENSNIDVIYFNGKTIGVEPPTFVELEVVDTVPGERGNTVQGGTKPATLETGAVVLVPLFVNVGDVLKIDTRTGEYLTRV